MKKIFLFISVLFVTIFLTACSAEKRLEKAFEELEKTSYTMEGSMRVDFTVNYYGQTLSQTMVTDMYMEIDPEQSYIMTTMNGQTQEVYYKMDGEYVDIYTKNGEIWEYESEGLDDYLEESDIYFLDIEVKDVFEEEDGVWVGNGEKITEMLKTSLDKVAEELVGTGVSIKKMSVDKYNIELKNNQISKLDIIISMKMSANGMEMAIKISMPMNIKNVGETKVTIPTGIK